jgi:hypothetical protein
VTSSWPIRDASANIVKTSGPKQVVRSSDAASPLNSDRACSPCPFFALRPQFAPTASFSRPEPAEDSHWFKIKNPDAFAVQREAEETWER